MVNNSFKLFTYPGTKIGPGVFNINGVSKINFITEMEFSSAQTCITVLPFSLSVKFHVKYYAWERSSCSSSTLISIYSPHIQTGSPCFLTSSMLCSTLKQHFGHCHIILVRISSLSCDTYPVNLESILKDIKGYSVENFIRNFSRV